MILSGSNTLNRMCNTFSIPFSPGTCSAGKAPAGYRMVKFQTEDYLLYLDNIWHISVLKSL